MKEKSGVYSVRVLLALSIALASVIGASPARAAPPSLLRTINGSETSAGEFEYSCGAAVDPAGYLYLSSYGTSSIDIFDPDHKFVTAIPDFGGPCELAADSEGHIYVKNTIEGAVSAKVKLLSPDSYPPTRTTKYTESTILNGMAGEESNGFAIDPATDRFYVTRHFDVAPTIAEYKSAAEGSGLVSSNIGASLATAEKITEFGSIAVRGSTGEIYVATTQNGDRAISVFDHGVTKIEHQIDGLPAEPPRIDIQQEDGNVVVSEIPVDGTVKEYATDGALESEIGPTFSGSLEFEDSSPSGLAVDNSSASSAGNIYVGSGTENSVYYEFGTAAPKLLLSVSKTGDGFGTLTSDPPGIDCGAICSAEFNEDEEVNLAASADSGSEFVEWTGSCSGSGSCTVTMNSAQSVGAVFNTPTVNNVVKLSVTRSGDGVGTVTSVPAGIDCGGSCEHEFNASQEVLLVATPAAGSAFKGWSGSCSGSGECKVTLNSAQTVNAEFSAEKLTPPPSIAVASKSGKAKSGRAELSLTCPGPGSCSGSLKLTARLKVGKGENSKPKRLTVGSRSFALAPGATGITIVKLSGPAKTKLAQAGALKVSVSGNGIQPTTVALKAGRRR